MSCDLVSPVGDVDMGFFIKPSSSAISLKTAIVSRVVLTVFVIGGTLTLVSLFMMVLQTKNLIQTLLKNNAEIIKEKVLTLMHGVEVDAKVYASLFDNYDFSDEEKLKSNLAFVTANIKANKDYDGFSFIDAKTGLMYRLFSSGEGNVLGVKIKPMGDGRFTSHVYEKFMTAGQREIDVDPNQVDPRTFLRYLEMKDADKPSWMNSRQTHSIKYLLDFPPFLSYFVPLRGKADGQLLGFICLDLGVLQLEEMLGKIVNQKSNFSALYEGIPFIIEKHKVGEVFVVGHPVHFEKNHDDIIKSDNAYAKYLHEINDHPDHRIKIFGKLVNEKLYEDIDVFNHESTFLDVIDDPDGVPWIYSWTAINPGYKPDWVVGVCVNRALVVQDIVLTGRIIFGSLILIIFVMIYVSLNNCKKLSDPLEKIAADVVDIGRGEINFLSKLDPNFKEIFILKDGIEKMKSGLLSFRKYIPYKVVNQVLASRKTAEPFAEKKELTIFFSDLENFTTISESMEPDKLVKLIGEHLAMCTNIIQGLEGTVDKYIGDSVMAFWNAPEDCEGHSVKACKVALRCQEEMLRFNERNRMEGLPELRMRIGISTGMALVGNIGSEDRLNYTAVGDTVNLASRLEGTNKNYKTLILISEKTNEYVKAEILTRPVDKVAVKGKINATMIHEVLGLGENATPELLRVIELSELGFGHYLARRFEQAIGCYQQILEIKNDDHVSLFYIERCRIFIEFPPQPGWDGIHFSASK